MFIVASSGYFMYGKFEDYGLFWGRAIYVDLDKRLYYSYGQKLKCDILIMDTAYE